MDTIDTYRTCHPSTAEYTFLSSAHRTFSRIDHILGHKATQQVSEDWNHTKHIFWSQWYKTGNQIGKFKKSQICGNKAH